MDILPSYLSDGICVIPSPFGGDAVWQGAKLVSNVRCYSIILSNRCSILGLPGGSCVCFNQIPR